MDGRVCTNCKFAIAPFPCHPVSDPSLRKVRAANNNPKIDIGSLDAMKDLRKNLNCKVRAIAQLLGPTPISPLTPGPLPFSKSFSWFLENVYPESMIKSASDVIGLGELRNAKTNDCMDTGSFDPIGRKVALWPCHGE